MSTVSGPTINKRAIEGLNHQMDCQSPAMQRLVYVARPRSSDRVTLPKAIEGREGLLSVISIHGVTAKKLPAFIRKQSKARLAGRNNFVKPSKVGSVPVRSGNNEAVGSGPIKFTSVSAAARSLPFFRTLETSRSWSALHIALRFVHD